MSCRSPVVRMPSSPNRRGQIQLILGPMFSGKSTELLRRIRRYQIAENQCLVIKYAKDDRYCQDYIATHDMQKIAACKATRLSDIGDTRTYTVIGVDEGQFFPDIAAFCDRMANQGKIVIVAALDGTFERKPFGSILEVIPLAEDVIKLSAVCTGCRNEAAFTKRTTTDQQVELIGGTDKYMAACRHCFNKPIAEKRPLPFKELTNQPACNVNVAAVKALVK